MFIRRETADDEDAIAAVHRAAFARPERDGDPIEVGLVDALRAADAVDGRRDRR
jgi:putative acetyltransferase